MNEHKRWMLSQLETSGVLFLVPPRENTDDRRAAAQELEAEGLIDLKTCDAFELKYALTPRGALERRRLP